MCPYGFVGGGVGGCVGWYVDDCVLARLTVGGDPLHVVISCIFLSAVFAGPAPRPGIVRRTTTNSTRYDIILYVLLGTRHNGHAWGTFCCDFGSEPIPRDDFVRH